jgi:hypothetical protein
MRDRDRGTYTDDTTSGSSTGISSFQRLFISTFSKIIFASMDDDHSSDDRFGSDQFDLLILDGSLCCSRGVGGNISEIAYVTGRCVWGTVGSITRIEMGSCTLATIYSIQKGAGK